MSIETDKAAQQLGEHSGAGGYSGASRSLKNTQVLSTINEASFSWFHVKAILVAGVGCDSMPASGPLSRASQVQVASSRSTPKINVAVVVTLC